MSTLKDYTGYVGSEFLDMIAHITRSQKQRSYARMQIQPDHRLLDVGCGSGTDTIPLAQLIGPMGQVVGVDHDEEMISKANQKAQEANVANRVIHKHVNATSLPFENDYFDSSRSDRVFQHLVQPEQVLFEMIRVTKSGGRVVVVDPDHGTFSVDTPEVDIEQKLLRAMVEKVVNNGFSGRKLYRQFKRQGLQDISLDMFAFPFTDYSIVRQVALLDRVEAEAIETGAVTQSELERWRSGLAQADAEGIFFASAALVMVAGCKP